MMVEVDIDCSLLGCVGDGVQRSGEPMISERTAPAPNRRRQPIILASFPEKLHINETIGLGEACPQRPRICQCIVTKVDTHIH